jgi:hypothetical protein
MGGREKVITAASEALQEGVRWAAQLVNYVYKLDPNDEQARQIKADAFRKMGQLAFGSIGRSILLSKARALEGKEDIPKVVPPHSAIIAASPTTFVASALIRAKRRRRTRSSRLHLATRLLGCMSAVVSPNSCQNPTSIHGRWTSRWLWMATPGPSSISIRLTWHQP